MQSKTFNKVLIALFAIVFIVSMIAIPMSFDVTYAESDLEDTWYYGSDGLNLLSAKQLVSGWDKSKLDKNDPVVIAVIDTGINQNHEVFDGVLMYNSESGIVNGYNSYRAEYGISGNAINDVGFGDSEYHGTNVASIIALLIKEFGLEDYIKIYPIRACKDVEVTDETNSFPLDSVTNAIEFCSSNEKIDIINLSLGIMGNTTYGKKWATDTRMKNAISTASASKVIIAAAGNKSTDSASDVFYPAAYDGVVSIMGYGKNGNMYTNSNYGSIYDFAAPAEDILVATKGNGESSSYGKNKGTSMAAPMVSFGAALLKLRLQVENKNQTSTNIVKILNNISYPSYTTYKTYSFNKFDIKTLVSGDIDSSKYSYSDPTDITITHNGEYGKDDYEDYIYMKRNNMKTTSFTAMVLPFGKVDPDLEGLLKWIEIDANGNERVVGTGLSLSYMPPSGGIYRIVARLNFGTKKLEQEEAIYVEYAQYYVQDVKVTYADEANKNKDDASSNGINYVTDKVRFSLTGIQYCDQSVEIKWYVNNQYVASGVVFEFEAKEEGTYSILAKYGDRGIVDDMVFTLTVKPNVERPLYLGLTIAGSIVGAILLALIIVLIIKKEKIKKLYVSAPFVLEEMVSKEEETKGDEKVEEEN